MPRKAMPKVPRKLGLRINDRQERFARAYAASLDKVEALKEAGYELATEDAARDAASRLLRNPSVRALVDELLAKTAAKYGMDADGTIMRLKFIYLEAVEDRDWSAAVSALRELGKVYGIFEKHNAQRKFTQEDVEKLRSELEQAGFDFSRRNFLASEVEKRSEN